MYKYVYIYIYIYIYMVAPPQIYILIKSPRKIQ